MFRRGKLIILNLSSTISSCSQFVEQELAQLEQANPGFRERSRKALLDKLVLSDADARTAVRAAETKVIYTYIHI